MIGFKSFLDPTEVNLTSGLTGVVGPNGCGKYNIVEAIKWVMGENSPKQMRSPEMNSIIFSGTNDRPSRNFAEVIIKINNCFKRSISALVRVKVNPKPFLSDGRVQTFHNSIKF